jgi:hypothetical protein
MRIDLDKLFGEWNCWTRQIPEAVDQPFLLGRGRTAGFVYVRCGAESRMAQMPDADPPDDRRIVDPDLERLKKESESLHIQSEDIIKRMKLLDDEVAAMEEEWRSKQKRG